MAYIPIRNFVELSKFLEEHLGEIVVATIVFRDKIVFAKSIRRIRKFFLLRRVKPKKFIIWGRDNNLRISAEGYLELGERKKGSPSFPNFEHWTRVESKNGSIIFKGIGKSLVFSPETILKPDILKEIKCKLRI